MPVKTPGKAHIFPAGFYVYLVSQVVSWLGDQIDRLALPWLVQELTGSPAALGMFAIASEVPDIIATPFVGALVDRVDRRRLMVAVDLASGVLVLLVALLTWRQLMQVWHLYVAIAVFSLARSAYGPAQMALLPRLVEPTSLTRANAFVSGLSQSAGIVGPAAAAGLIAVGGLAGGIAVDGASFLVAALLLSFVRPLTSTAQLPELPRTPILAGVAEGFQYIRCRPVIRAILMCFALTNFGTAPLWVLLPTFVNILGSGPSGMAMLTTALAIGGLIGAFTSAAMHQVKRKGILVVLSMAGGAAIMIALALAPTLPVAVAWTTLFGFTFPLAQVNVNVIYQNIVPPQMQGRVFAIRFFIARCLSPLGAGVAGLFAVHVGVRAVFVVGALVGVLASLAALMVKPLRELQV